MFTVNYTQVHKSSTFLFWPTETEKYSRLHAINNTKG